MSPPVSVRIPDPLVEELDQVAKTTERSRSYHIQKALESYLEKQADLQIALDRLRDPVDPVVPLDEMKKLLDA